MAKFSRNRYNCKNVNDLELLTKILKKYQSQLNGEKKREYLERLVEVGANEARPPSYERVQSVHGRGKTRSYTPARLKLDVHLDAGVDSDDSAHVALKGEDAAFAEFGTGVSYNAGSTYGVSHGMSAIGTYGKGKGSRQKWGFNHRGKSYITRGIPANQGLLQAQRAINESANAIAKEVFEID